MKPSKIITLKYFALIYSSYYFGIKKCIVVLSVYVDYLIAACLFFWSLVTVFDKARYLMTLLLAANVWWIILMALKTIPKPFETSMAKMPLNEERRPQAVVKTGLVDAPNFYFRFIAIWHGILRVLSKQSSVFLTVSLSVQWQNLVLTITTKWVRCMIGQNGMCVPMCCWTQSPWL